MKIALSFALLLSNLAFAAESQDLSLETELKPADSILCPAVYNPAVCTYLEFSAEGTNSCHASLALRALVLSKGLEFNPALVNCEAGL